tara:strand:+ start:15194 stop:17407 length:2214 start_codon:yes stop_codon:yes gene_type:complete
MSNFFAHSGLQADKADWQLLAEHLLEVGNLAAQSASYFGAGELARTAGRLHDLGKYTDEFQARLAGDYGKVDHSTWGARIAVERFGGMGLLLAYGIAGHHAGLANGRDTGERTSLGNRLLAELPRLQAAWQQEVDLPARLIPPEEFKVVGERGFFQLAFLARMIFSSLVDADFLDTEAYYHKLEKKQLLRTHSQPTLLSLRSRLDGFLDGFQADTPVNKLRANILMRVREQALHTPGIFSLTVPTGGGKTLASFAFALDHAIAHNLRRVIFVIPFTSIVEQNAAVFRRALGDLSDAVLEHHSSLIDETGKSAQAKEKTRLAMENWDAPIVVTTAVQFFESLYAARPSTCRKLHNISSSVVILDEAQTMPIKLLKPCVTALSELALNYRVSPVLCTATQPALQAPDFVDGLCDVRELAPDPEKLFLALKRVEVRHLGTLSDERLAQLMTESEQVLCIVNNRQHARCLFQSILPAGGALHLTTLMCAKHRSGVLSEVRRRLLSGEPCRLVSTSLIEAGVDVDFPQVLRAEAGLDSIAQAAGRCNREGRRASSQSVVSIFATENPDWAPPPELKQYAQAAREILRQLPDDPLGLEAIRRYFQLLYWQKGPQELDARNLLGQIEAAQLQGLPFEMLANEFRMIDSVQKTVIVPWDEDAVRALRDLEFAEGCGKIARQLQPYLVQVPQKAFAELIRVGAVQAVQPEKYGEQFMALANPDLYDESHGLHWDNPAFIASERLLW